MKLKLLTLFLLVSSLVFAEDEDKYDPSQNAILFASSKVCHAENLGSNYKNMLAKTTPTNSVYVLKISLT